MFDNTLRLIEVPTAAKWKEFVYKIQVNPIHIILKYGDYYDMTLWKGNGAVLKSSSQWQLEEVLKMNNSVHE